MNEPDRSQDEALRGFINGPLEGQEGDVVGASPTATTGNLCRCYGTFRPSPGMTGTVYLVLGGAQAPQPSDKQFKKSSYTVVVPMGQESWEFKLIRECPIWQTGDPKLNCTVWVRAVDNSMPTPTVRITQASHFTGRRAPQCKSPTEESPGEQPTRSLINKPQEGASASVCAPSAGASTGDLCECSGTFCPSPGKTGRVYLICGGYNMARPTDAQFRASPYYVDPDGTGAWRYRMLRGCPIWHTGNPSLNCTLWAQAVENTMPTPTVKDTQGVHFKGVWTQSCARLDSAEESPPGE